MPNEIIPSRRVFKVPAENVDLLQTQIDVVNQRVNRLRKRGHDVASVTVTVGKPYVAVLKGTDRVFVDVELLTPEPPKICGWEFVASLTHVDGVGAVLRVCPGAVVSEGELKKYREASPNNCDHCHAQRKRVDTFVVRDLQGELKQVGRQCLQAYTGLADPEILCHTAEILFSVSEMLSDSEDDDFGGGFREGERYVTIARFLPYVCCSIRTDGWLSSTTAREQGRAGQSTCNLAFSHGVYAKRDAESAYKPEERDYNLASAVIEFCEDHFAGADIEKLSDYENSLRVAMASGIAHPKFAGLVASAVTFYKRDVERRARNESWAEMVAKSRFQGTVGERSVFEGLRVLSCHEWQGEYGVTYFYSFVDGEHNAFAYFASRDMMFEVGQVVGLRGTVKKHEVRTSIKKHEIGTSKKTGLSSYQQTVLTRCSLVARAKVETCNVMTRPVLGAMAYLNELTAKGKPPVEKVHKYHLVGLDGRKFCLTTKSKKKGLVVGVDVVVSYDSDCKLRSSEDAWPVSLITICDKQEKLI